MTENVAFELYAFDKLHFQINIDADRYTWKYGKNKYRFQLAFHLNAQLNEIIFPRKHTPHTDNKLIIKMYYLRSALYLNCGNK